MTGFGVFVVVFVVAIGIIAFIFDLREEAKKSEEEQRRMLDGVRKERQKQAEEFRKIFGLSNEITIYNEAGFCSTSPMNPTSHESSIANDLVNAGLFNRYYVFLDYYFKTQDGLTGQIDVIAVGKRGVFIFESKDYSGWIYGNGKSAKWSEMLHGKKYRFYSPIRQNQNHIKKLKTILKDKKMHSIIVFGRGATIKEIDYIPKDTYVVTNDRLIEAVKDVIEHQSACLSSVEVLNICRELNKKRLFCSKEMADRHIKRIREDVTGEDRLYS